MRQNLETDYVLLFITHPEKYKWWMPNSNKHEVRLIYKTPNNAYYYVPS